MMSRMHMQQRHAARQGMLLAIEAITNICPNDFADVLIQCVNMSKGIPDDQIEDASNRLGRVVHERLRNAD